MSLEVKNIILPSAHFGGESSLPSIYQMSNVQYLSNSKLDEDDELFVGYGQIPSIFPYRIQDLYDRAADPTEYIGVVLENKYLKAVFLPELGGKLWSLYDKVAGRDLLFTNVMVRPCNLAVRNAWTSGGIEFNCGMIGHHPFTCSKIFACETKLDDGTPVLRMYEFERIRRCVYQMDFFLPEESKILYARMRIVNPNREVVPMYWWTNIAVREDRHARNVIDATETYNNANGCVGKNPVPIHNGIDITYPTNNPVAIDYFWKIPDSARKFTSHIGADGYGFFQASTSRLKGRKLFVWGQGEGGARWQKFLTADDADGRYVEIQAGLAHTQYECLPMPPLTAWEWLECYGAINTDPEKVHGDWDTARAEVREKINEAVSEESLEKLLIETKPMAKRASDKMICYGSTFGKLENLRREKAGEPQMCPHLDFGEIGENEAIWADLLEHGTLEIKDKKEAEKPPRSWMFQREWTEIIEKSADCHEKYLHLAAIYIGERRLRDAGEAIEKALAYRETATALFILSQYQRLTGNGELAAETALRAASLLPDDISLVRRAFEMGYRAGKYDAIVSFYKAAPASTRADGRISMYFAFALLRLGNIDDAKAVLYRDGGLAVTDIQEGEVSITSLYIEIEKATAIKAGHEISEAEIYIPEQFDFRMFVPKKKEK